MSRSSEFNNLNVRFYIGLGYLKVIAFVCVCVCVRMKDEFFMRNKNFHRQYTDYFLFDYVSPSFMIPRSKKFSAFFG